MKKQTKICESPWTVEQVEMLNRLQRGKLFGHPYTCPHRGDAPHHHNGNDLGCLIATKTGWWCPDCGFTQNWFYASSIHTSRSMSPNKSLFE